MAASIGNSTFNIEVLRFKHVCEGFNVGKIYQIFEYSYQASFCLKKKWCKKKKKKKKRKSFAANFAWHFE